MLDTVGNKGATKEIAMIKVIVPLMVQNVIDRAIQVFGGAGLSDDTPLAGFFAITRAIRFVDGPDEVHKRTISRLEIKQQLERKL